MVGFHVVHGVEEVKLSWEPTETSSYRRDTSDVGLSESGIVLRAAT